MELKWLKVACEGFAIRECSSFPNEAIWQFFFNLHGWICKLDCVVRRPFVLVNNDKVYSEQHKLDLIVDSKFESKGLHFLCMMHISVAQRDIFSPRDCYAFHRNICIKCINIPNILLAFGDIGIHRTSFFWHEELAGHWWNMASGVSPIFWSRWIQDETVSDNGLVWILRSTFGSRLQHLTHAKLAIKLSGSIFAEYIYAQSNWR